MALAETFGAASWSAFDGSSDDVFAEMIAAVRVRRGRRDGRRRAGFGAQLATAPTGSPHVADDPERVGRGLPRLGDRQMVALLDDGIARAIGAAPWRRCGALVRRQAGAAGRLAVRLTGVVAPRDASATIREPGLGLRSRAVRPPGARSATQRSIRVGKGARLRFRHRGGADPC